MKILVLTFGILVMLSFTASETDTNPTSIPETYNLINATGNLPIAKPGCNTSCGDLIVPYPFGVGLNSNCSIGDGFDVYCNTSSDPYKAFFTEAGQYGSIKKISDSTLRTSNLVASRCYYPDGSIYNSYNISYDFSDWPYTFSQVNKFTVVGCDDYAWLTSETQGSGDQVSTGCMVFCSNVNSQNTSSDECSGNGCCQSSIPRDISYYTTRLRKLLDSDEKNSSERCSYAFVGEEDTFKYNGAADLLDSSFVKRVEDNVPVVLDWAIGNLSCAEAKLATEGYACQSNSTCVDSVRKSGGYRCQCNEGYEGNPYLYPGCQDINECADPGIYPCYGICNNTLGNYNCTCEPGFIGNATTQNGCQVVDAKASKFSWTIFVIAMVLGLFAILSGIITGSFFGIRRRKLMKLREKFFEQNGGVLLKQKLNSQGSHEVMALFSTQQLRKATNNYSQDQIVGRGAYGVVYKGVLSDERVVAVKKSKLVDGGQAEQFINEVLILTQVIHRNVVKLLGCCLEEEVPVLVYEFISNNTLFHHLHHRSGGMSWLSWDNRLRVAVEVAGALAYLHSETIMPIIHRDVKSTNILIDENYNAKISDFGASRLVPLDHDQVTTLIQGTLGYLDPEYFNTSQLTEKSDVYSFGVVLTELITGKKPIGVDRTNTEKNLATYFVNSIEENRLFEIVEPRLLREGTLEQLQAIGNLVKRCLGSKGRDRPTMKEVAVELEGMRKLPHPWLQQQTCEETRSLVLEVEQSDLYDVPLVSYATNEWETYSGSTALAFEENKPR